MMLITVFKDFCSTLQQAQRSHQLIIQLSSKEVGKAAQMAAIFKSQTKVTSFKISIQEALQFLKSPNNFYL